MCIEVLHAGVIRAVVALGTLGHAHSTHGALLVGSAVVVSTLVEGVARFGHAGVTVSPRKGLLAVYTGTAAALALSAAYLGLGMVGVI